jgi:hypothetical protein
MEFVCRSFCLVNWNMSPREIELESAGYFNQGDVATMKVATGRC